jgi:hypothetical protein
MLIEVGQLVLYLFPPVTSRPVKPGSYWYQSTFNSTSDKRSPPQFTLFLGRSSLYVTSLPSLYLRVVIRLSCVGRYLSYCAKTPIRSHAQPPSHA